MFLEALIFWSSHCKADFLLSLPFSNVSKWPYSLSVFKFVLSQQFPTLLVLLGISIMINPNSKVVLDYLCPGYHRCPCAPGTMTVLRPTGLRMCCHTLNLHLLVPIRLYIIAGRETNKQKDLPGSPQINLIGSWERTSVVGTRGWVVVCQGKGEGVPMQWWKKCLFLLRLRLQRCINLLKSTECTLTDWWIFLYVNYTFKKWI